MFTRLVASGVLVVVAACGPQDPTPSGALAPGASARSQAVWVLADVRPPAETADAFRVLATGHGLVAGERTAWARSDDGGWVPADPVTDWTRNGITGWRDGLVAWADGSVITTSRDGVSWAEASQGPVEGTPSRVVAIGNRLVPLGDATNERLGAWSAATAPRVNDGEPLSLLDVAVGGPAIVTIGCVGEHPAGWVSSSAPSAWRQSLDLREPDSWLNDVEHAGPGFVIAGRRGGRPARWISTDGGSWTLVGLQLPAGGEGTGTASRVVTTDERMVVFGYATADAGNGGDFATAYLVWTLEPGGR